jgi:serine/threonine-protein kinase
MRSTAAVQTIRLERGEWSFDETDQLGPAGGFGEVFRGHGNEVDVAVKRLKLSAGAASHREMKIGAVLADRTHPHVVPILDHGQDAESDRYYLVMPICERSLQDELATGPLPFEEAKAAALDIAAGLSEVPEIVHRDLKPGNVLWHDGSWKIADFGIAKFVEDATSLESLRTSLTPSYAAPEQWRGERPTGATDVYALGCIIYALLTGRPPFTGDSDSIREAHLHSPPPSLTGVDSRLVGLVASMLRKVPASRPSLARCVAVLSQVQTPLASSARQALAAIGQVISQEEAAAEAASKARETALRERRDLATEAGAELRAIVARLFDTIETDTQSARRERSAIVLGPAHLTFEGPQAGFSTPPTSGDAWDIPAFASLTLRAARGDATAWDPGYYVFSASLVFAKIPSDPEYRWRELSFHEIFSRRSNFEQPFSLNPTERDFLVTVSNVAGRHQIAHGPFAIDGEDEASFQDRWLTLFAKAAGRELGAPSQLPLPPSFFK